MEAHGHEEIGKVVTNFIKKIIKEKYHTIYKQIYLNEETGKEHDTDEVRNSFYLGNWLADNSQLFAPDTIFNFKMSSAKGPERWNKAIDYLFDSFCIESNSIGIKIQKIIYTTAIVAYEVNKGIEKTEEEIKELYKNSVEFLKKEGNISINALIKLKKLTIPKVDLSIIAKATAKSLKNKNSSNDKNTKSRKDSTKSGKSKALEFSMDIQNKIETQIANLRDVLKFPETLIDVLKSSNAKKQTNFVYDNRMEIWEIILAVLKLNGYRKFVKGENMNFDNFKAIIDSYIETQSSIQVNPANEKSLDRFRFKLNQYYPSDHLDRAFDINKLNQFPQNKGKLFHYLADDINYETQRYKYLEDFIQIAAERLTILNINWIIPTFYKKKSLKPIENRYSRIVIPEGALATKDFYLNFARLGQTLHIVEDFFAHSNFLELTVTNLDALRHPIYPRQNFYSQAEFLSKLKPYELKRYAYAMIKSGKLNEEGKFTFPTKIEENLVTGSFAEGDMAHSFYHLAFGYLEKKMHAPDYAYLLDLELEYCYPDILEKQEKYTETDKVDTLHFFYSEFLNLVDADKDDEFFINFFKKEEYFTKQVFDYIFKERTALREEKNWIPFDLSLREDEIEYLRNLFNQVIHLAEKIMALKEGIEKTIDIYTSFDTLKELMKIVAALLCLFIPGVGLRAIKTFILSVIKRYIVEVIGETLYKSIREVLNEVVSMFFSEILENLGTLVETHILKTFSPERRGSHSLLAKDEAYKNQHFNRIAIEAAIFADKALVLALLTENYLPQNSKSHSIHSVDIHKLLKGLLSHPLSGNSPDKLDKYYSENTLVSIHETTYDAQSNITVIFNKISLNNPFTELDSLKQMLIDYNQYLILKDFTDNTYLGEACNRLQIEPEAPPKQDAKKSYSQSIDSANIIMPPPSNMASPQDNMRQYKINFPITINAPISTETQNRYHWAITLFNKSDKKMPYDYDYTFVDFASDQVEGFIKNITPSILLKNKENIEEYSTLAAFFQYYQLGVPQLEFLDSAQTVANYSLEENSKEYQVKRAHEKFMEAYINKIKPEKK